MGRTQTLRPTIPTANRVLTDIMLTEFGMNDPPNPHATDEEFEGC
jgi:hypothetical protein